VTAQPRLPGTLPAPEAAWKAHADAVHHEREAEKAIDGLKDALRAAREALKQAQKDRRTAEDDLAAIEAGRRPG
jgi:hypothetical protein